MLPAATSCSSGFHRCARALVDQLDLRLAAFANPVAELGGELQAARPSADDDYLVERGLVNGEITTGHCLGPNPAWRTGS
jgi:hypothetical protein